jgi:hypothetical protein
MQWKKLTGQTQRRAGTFGLQTSCCYINNLILDKAVSMLEETFPLSLFAKVDPPLVGGKISIKLSSDGQDDPLPQATIFWDKSNCIKTGSPSRFLGWLCSNILAELGPGALIRGCTEHKRITPTGVVVGVGTIGACFHEHIPMGRHCIFLAKPLHS